MPPWNVGCWTGNRQAVAFVDDLSVHAYEGANGRENTARRTVSRTREPNPGADSLTSVSTANRTLDALLRDAATQSSDPVAIVSPRRAPLSYGRLWDHVQGVAGWLEALGTQPRERIAIVVPNGPEMATSFLGASLVATTAPLNPNLTVDEFSYYLAELAPRAVITETGMNTAVRTVAAAHGIPVVELTPHHSDAAGIFGLNGDVLRPTNRARVAEPDDVALLLHTSGTTSRPKRVPLTHNNLCWSAQNVARALDLSADDRCLNVMPLFHIHGIVAALLASLASRGSVACSPGFDDARFFDWMRQLRPTWYTAVPTIHQAVMRRAEHAPGEIPRSCLRFVRSSSAPLADRVITDLEALFGVPVIDAYGMTEAAHQIASNRLSASMRRRGSVGLAEGCEIGIMDGSGTLLPPGASGEIVIRGPNVTQGYEDAAEANARTFVNGWCRTGDWGMLDADGFLSLTGRLKDIINRGGEKIAPQEIDDVLLMHPDVREAVAFAVPHPTLGESIAAAVTTREGRTVSEIAVRHFAAAHLPDFKIPDRILVVDSIPKGPTGKVRRAQLADHFASALREAYEPPASPLEQSCVAAFEHVLELSPVGRNDNFFALGGDSIRATQVISDLVGTVGVDLPPTTLFRHPTPALLASELSRLMQEDVVSQSTLIPLQTHGSKAPFFWIHGDNSDAFLPRYLGPDRPVYALVHQSQDGSPARFTTVEEIAGSYLEEIRTVQPSGPYLIGGFCFGALVAFEIAHQLTARGDEVRRLALIGPSPLRNSPSSSTSRASVATRKAWWKRLRNEGWRHWQNLQQLHGRERFNYVRVRTLERLSEVINKMTSPPIRALKWGLCTAYHSVGVPIPYSLRSPYILGVYRRAKQRYAVRTYPGSLSLFVPPDASQNSISDWSGLATGTIEIHEIPDGHEAILNEPYVQVWAEKLKACLESAKR
jgi:oxalate---CoA ligase